MKKLVFGALTAMFLIPCMGNASMNYAWANKVFGFTQNTPSQCWYECQSAPEDQYWNCYNACMNR